MNQLANYNLLEDATRECPFAYFGAMRREAPVHFMPEIGSWYVSRYEDVPHSFLRGLKHLNIEFDVRNREPYRPRASVY